MKRIIINLLVLSICFAGGQLPTQIESLKDVLQKKYNIYSVNDLQKLKKSPTNQTRLASRDMEDLVGDWVMEDLNFEVLITVGTDQSMINVATVTAMDEAEGSITATADSFETDLTYLMMGSENEEDEEEDEEMGILIMNMNMMEMFMMMYGSESPVDNPTLINLSSSTGDDDFDMVMGMVLGDTSMIMIAADSLEALAAITVDTLAMSITINSLNLYDLTGSVVLTLSGTIGPGMIDLVAGEETSIDLGMFSKENDEYISYYDDSTGMRIEVYVDEYYDETYMDTSYFEWMATSDSLFVYYDGDDYYDEEPDSIEMEYYISDDSLFTGGYAYPCEEEGFDSFEECMQDVGLPGFDNLVDVQNFRVHMEQYYMPHNMTAIEPANGKLPGEFKLYANYPNPFNPVTTIRFDVGEASHESTLRIYDISGRNVATLINGQLQSGTYEVKWDARGIASGIYISELISGQNRQTQKMVLLK